MIIQDLKREQALQLADYMKRHVKPGGYLFFSSFIGPHSDAVVKVFEDWNSVTRFEDKIKVSFTGQICDAMEVLLQKPGGQ